MDVDFLTDKIRELCARILAAQGAEFELAVDELRAFIREHKEQIIGLLEQPSVDASSGFDGHYSDHGNHLC